MRGTSGNSLDRICPRSGGALPALAVRCSTCGLTSPAQSPEGDLSSTELVQRARELAQEDPLSRLARTAVDRVKAWFSWARLRRHPWAPALLLLAVAGLAGIWWQVRRPPALPVEGRLAVLAESHAARQLSALRVLREGERALAARDHATALATLTRAVELGADTGRIRYLRGLSALELGRWQEAVKDFSAIEGGKPDPVSVWVSRGLAFEGLGNYRAALADYQRAVEGAGAGSPRAAEIYHHQGRTHLCLGELPQALEALTRAIAAGEGGPEIYFQRGQVYERLEQDAAALEDYSRALALQPRLAAAWLRRGLVQVRLGRYEQAVADLTRTLELGVRDPQAYSHRGLAFAHLGNYEAARQDLESAVRLGGYEAKGALRTVAALEKAALRQVAAASALSTRTDGPSPSRGASGRKSRPRRR